MNDKGTTTETSKHVLLTSVDSGSICRLEGISEMNPPRGKHGHRHWFGWGRHHSHWEKRKDHWHQRWQAKSERWIMKRLLDLGLTKGCSFKVIQSRGRGPVLVEVRGTRIALGYGLANKLMVEVIGDTR